MSADVMPAIEALRLLVAKRADELGRLRAALAVLEGDEPQDVSPPATKHIERPSMRSERLGGVKANTSATAARVLNALKGGAVHQTSALKRALELSNYALTAALAQLGDQVVVTGATSQRRVQLKPSARPSRPKEED